MDLPKDSELLLIKSVSSNFSYTLDIDLNKGYTHAIVSSVCIPKTYYVLPNNAILTVTEGTNTTNIIFSKGNYSYTSFQIAFNTNMSSCNWDYSIVYNTNTPPDIGKYQYNVTGNTSQPSFKTTDSFLASVLGIYPNITYNFSGNSFTSPNVIDFQAYDSLLLISDIVRNKNKILQEIFTNINQYNSSIVWQNNNYSLNCREIINLQSNNINFSLQDNSGNVVDLNGSEFSFVMILFKKNNIADIIKTFIELHMNKQELENVDA